MFVFCKFNNLKFLKNISWEDQKWLLERTILHPLNKEFPIKQKYQLSFLRKIIENLEFENVEVHDLIYEKFCELQTNCQEDNDFTFKHYSLPEENVVISLKEAKSFVTEGTTGLCSWQSSIALSEWLLSHRDLICRKKVLELGSGTGLCGFVVSKCCNPSEIILTDGSPKVLNLLNENLKKNFKQSKDLNVDQISCFVEYENKKIITFLLPWENIKESGIDIVPDVILAADVVYDSSVFVALSTTIDYIFTLSDNQCVMILAATIRNEETLKEFLQILESLELNAVEEDYISCTDQLFWDETTPIKIFSIRRIKMLK